MSATVGLRSVTKRFGAVRAVDDVSLEIEAGEFLTLLGPSGCGKTTLLRILAGFERPDAGAVWIGGADVTTWPAHRRDVNQVFQSYALFPHLSVADNIGFGLRMQRLASDEIARRVSEMVELVALAGCEGRKPHEISGGQQQRVALARALAPRPAVLLLDEPLSALDAQLRQTMQLELKRLQRQVGTTFVFVTHDQEEALTMSDRIVLIDHGRIVQCGDAHEIYHRPVNAFAAEFIGQTNLLPAEVVERGGELLRCRLESGLVLEVAAGVETAGRVRLSIRPEKLQLHRVRPARPNCFAVRVEEVIFRGPLERMIVLTDSGLRLIVVQSNESAHEERVRVADTLWCVVHPTDVVVLADAKP
jgi:spermidine/putrescine transport system ATP-binding protein